MSAFETQNVSLWTIYLLNWYQIQAFITSVGSLLTLSFFQASILVMHQSIPAVPIPPGH